MKIMHMLCYPVQNSGASHGSHVVKPGDLGNSLSMPCSTSCKHVPSRAPKFANPYSCNEMFLSAELKFVFFLKNRDKEAVSPISGLLLAEKRYVRLMNSNALLIAMRWVVNACYVKTPHPITRTNFLIFHLLFAYSDRISPRALKINCKALKELGKEKVP